MRNIHPASIRDYSNLVGVPYTTLNCFGLVKRFYKEILDTELKHYFDEQKFPEDRLEVQNLIYTSKGDFEKVEDPQFGDLVLVKIEGLESHIGVYLGRGLFLHSLKSINASVIDRVGRWKHSITGYFRLREAND